MDRKGSKRSFSADITSLNDSWKRSRGADHGFSALDFRKPALLLTCAPGKEALAVKDLSAFLEEEIVHSIDKGGKEEVEEVKGNTVSSALEEELRSIRDKEQQKANIRGFWKQKSGSGIAFLQL